MKLAPDVIKNTNLKIVHRVVAQDDRNVLAGTMAMHEKQANALSTLLVGQAVVFSEGDDAPVLIKIPQMKGYEGQQVTTHMPYIGERVQQLSHPFTECKGTCIASHRICQNAQRIIGTISFQRTFARMVLSIMEAENFFVSIKQKL